MKDNKDFKLVLPIPEGIHTATLVFKDIYLKLEDIGEVVLTYTGKLPQEEKE